MWPFAIIRPTVLVCFISHGVLVADWLGGRDTGGRAAVSSLIISAVPRRGQRACT